MPIDARIPLGVQNIQFPDPLRGAERALTLKGMLGQQRGQEQQYRANESAMAREAKKQSLAQQYGDDLPGLGKAFMANGYREEAMTIGKYLSDQRDSDRGDSDSRRKSSIGLLQGLLGASENERAGLYENWFVPKYRELNPDHQIPDRYDPSYVPGFEAAVKGGLSSDSAQKQRHWSEYQDGFDPQASTMNDSFQGGPQIQPLLDNSIKPGQMMPDDGIETVEIPAPAASPVQTSEPEQPVAQRQRYPSMEIAEHDRKRQKLEFERGKENRGKYDDAFKAYKASGVRSDPLAWGLAVGRYQVATNPNSGQHTVVDKAQRHVADLPADYTPPPTRALAGPEATGGSSVFSGVGNFITDLFGFPLASPEAKEAVTALEGLNVQTITTMQAAIPGKPNVFTQEKIDGLTASPSSLMTGDRTAHAKLKELRRIIVQGINSLERDIINRPDVTKPNTMEAARAKVGQLKSLVTEYDAMIEGFDRKFAPKRPITDYDPDYKE